MSDESAPSLRARAIVVAGFGLAALVLQLPIFARSFLILDEGYVMSIAAAINRGDVAYRDINVDAPFPGSFYVLAGWFQAFGTSVYSSRLLAMGLFVTFTMALLWLALEMVSRRTACVLGVLLLCYRIWAFPLWHTYGYQALSLTLVTLAMATTATAMRRGSLAMVSVAGAFAGAGVLCKQDYGLAVTGVLGIVLLLSGGTPLPATGTRRLRAAVQFAGGAAVVLVPAFLALLIAGALPGLWEQSVRVPFAGAHGSSYPDLPPLRGLFGQSPGFRDNIAHYFPAVVLSFRWVDVTRSYLFAHTPFWDMTVTWLFYLPVFAWPLAALSIGLPSAYRLVRGRPLRHDALRILLVAHGLAFLAAFPRPRDWAHLMMIISPTFVLVALALDHAWQRLPRVAAAALGGGVALALAVLAVVSIRLGVDLREQNPWYLTNARAQIYTDAPHGALIEDILPYLDAAAPPGAPIPVYPTHPMLGFMADRMPVAGFYIVWPFQTADRDDRLIDALERQHVSTVLYGFSQFSHLGSFEQNAPRLFEYLATHFEIARVFSRELWGPYFGALRRRETPAGVSILDALPAGGPGSRALWPFTTVLTAPVGTTAAPVVTTVDVAVPAQGSPRLEFGYSTHPDRWQDFAIGPVTFTLQAGAQGETTLFQQTIDPSHRIDERHWFDASVSLAPYAGTTVRLRFVTQADTVPASPERVAGWRDPRVVVTP